MNAKQKALITIERLKEKYPYSECSLEYKGEAWKLLIMAILSAQCTDARVNTVSETLFKRFPSVKSFADADIEDIEEYIKPCGLYKNKAKSIKNSCADIINRFGGEVPSDMDGLLSLSGVGRKIANLMIGDVFGGPAIVTDTHCIRLSERIGLTQINEKSPLRTERALLKIIPKEESSDFCHRLVDFGREVCRARSPLCGECPLSDICRRYRKEKRKLIQA